MPDPTPAQQIPRIRRRAVPQRHVMYRSTPATTKSSNNYYQPDHPGGPSERGHESTPNTMQQTMRWRQLGHGTDSGHITCLLAALFHELLKLAYHSFPPDNSPNLGHCLWSSLFLRAPTHALWPQPISETERERAVMGSDRGGELGKGR